MRQNIVFFFQAEDGIRDLYVTGVQTCALPISATSRTPTQTPPSPRWPSTWTVTVTASRNPVLTPCWATAPRPVRAIGSRSEERRVGKECRYRWWLWH